MEYVISEILNVVDFIYQGFERESLNLNEEKIICALESLRKRRNLFIALIPCVIVVISVIFTCMLWVMGETFFFKYIYLILAGTVFLIIIFTLILVGKLRETDKKYTKTYKQMISENVLNDCFDDVSYFPEQGFTLEEFQSAKLIFWRSEFCYHSEDFIMGISKGIAFRQSDVRITHMTGSGRKRRTVVDVDGRLIQFVHHKAIKGRVLIVKRGLYALLDVDYEKIEMEDVDFNQKFNVYADDMHSVYYLLTPHMMEYIKGLYSVDRTIYINFDGENLYILRSGRGGIFSPPYRKIDLSKEIHKAKRELNEINHIIEILQLDDR